MYYLLFISITSFLLLKSTLGLKMTTNFFYEFVQIFVTLSRRLSLKTCRQNCRKSNVDECIFYYMASHIECPFNKNALLQCYFLAILPAGYLQFTCNNKILHKPFNYHLLSWWWLIHTVEKQWCCSFSQAYVDKFNILNIALWEI